MFVVVPVIRLTDYCLYFDLILGYHFFQGLCLRKHLLAGRRGFLGCGRIFLDHLGNLLQADFQLLNGVHLIFRFGVYLGNRYYGAVDAFHDAGKRRFHFFSNGNSAFCLRNTCVYQLVGFLGGLGALGGEIFYLSGYDCEPFPVDARARGFNRRVEREYIRLESDILDDLYDV